MCNIEALGMESGRIPDNKITASSEINTHVASKARLNGNSYWEPSAADTNTAWLQVGQFKIFIFMN